MSINSFVRMPSILIASWASVLVIFGSGAISQSFIHGMFLFFPLLAIILGITPVFSAHSVPNDKLASSSES